jgi:hypothetical protein
MNKQNIKTINAKMDPLFETKDQIIDINPQIGNKLNITVKRETKIDAKNGQLINQLIDNKPDVKREINTGMTAKQEMKSRPRSQSVSEGKPAEVVKRRRSEVEEYFFKQLINN